MTGRIAAAVGACDADRMTTEPDEVAAPRSPTLYRGRDTKGGSRVRKATSVLRDSGAVMLVVELEPDRSRAARDGSDFGGLVGHVVR